MPFLKRTLFFILILIQTFIFGCTSNSDINWPVYLGDHDSSHFADATEIARENEDKSEKRLYFSAGPFLHCINAVNGKPVLTFGDNGRISLKQGLDKDVADRFILSNTPGVIFEDKIIVGTRVDETSGAAPGHIHAFNIHSGEREWIFHTIPKPGEFGSETWPENAWKNIGGANSWTGMSVDHTRGYVFVPTGSASYDFYGGDRLGENLFANCVLALNARTGERVWHFQTIHHDIWDRDLPAPPNLATITLDGGGKLGTKSGDYYVAVFTARLVL